MTFAEHRDDVVIAKFCHDLKLRTCRLDYLDNGVDTIIRQRKMLRPHAKDGWPSVAAGRRATEEKFHASRRFECPSTVQADTALEHVHGRRADETSDKKIVGTIVEIQWRTDLFHAPVMHHDDLVGHGHGFD